MTANQINVTEGTGKSVATETISGVDYQKIKLADGKVGSSSVLSFVNNGTAVPVSVMGTLTINPTSVSGTVGASIIGVVPVSFANANQSVSGRVDIGSVIGSVTPYAQPNSFVQGVTSVMTTTSSVLVLSAPSATLKNHATHIMATNSGAVGTYVNIIDGGQVIYAGYAAASGGGFSSTLPTPLRQPTSGIGMYAATTATTSVVVAITGYVA